MSNDLTRDFFESQVPFDHGRIHAAAVYCSDGRFGEQFCDFMRNSLNLPRYDRLAIPGGAACMARHFSLYREADAVSAQLHFLIDVHGLQHVVLIAHQDCAFYSHRLQISSLQLESQQRDDMSRAVERVQSLGTHLQVAAFFARKQRDNTVQFEPVPI